jgi:nicotinate-nucleotide adenylyltransferase
MRVGVLGGTFDPVHYGHLLIAEEALACLQLSRVLFVPAKNPPHKLGQQHTRAEQRLQMVQLAVASNPGFCVSDIDLRRPGPSYTADTLAALQEELGPEAELYFVMGLDSLAALLTWRRPAEIIQRARLVAASRPGYAADLQALETALPGIAARTHLLSTPEIGIASHDLQRRVRQGLPIKYQVPEAVEAYIAEHRLYCDAPAAPLSMTAPRGAG